MPQQRISEQRRQRIYAWLEEPKNTRMSQSGLRKQLHLSYARFAEIQRDWKAERDRDPIRAEVQVRTVMEKIHNPEEGDVFDDPEFRKLSKLKQNMMRKLYLEFMEKGDPNRFFRMAQIMGWVVEKPQEVNIKIGLSADEIARQEKEANKELKEWDTRRGRAV